MYNKIVYTKIVGRTVLDNLLTFSNWEVIMFERFTEGAIKIIMLSQEEAKRTGHAFVGTEQILLGIIGQRHGIAAQALKRAGVYLRRTRHEIKKYVGRGNGFAAAEIPFTPRAKRVLEMSLSESKDMGQGFVGTEHILLALLGETEGVGMRTLRKMDIDIRYLRDIIYELIQENHEDIVRPLTKAERFMMERERRGSTTPTLDEFSENLSEDAWKGRLDPVLGREKEMNDLMAVLGRRSKNNPVLIGEPGVGKTAVAEGLAQLILNEKVPRYLDGSVVIALDLGSLLAGTKYRGEFEERIKRIVEEVQKDPSVVLLIDEIHMLVGAGAAEGAVDAANILKPALARGKLRCIGATTKDEYRKYIERDPALERRFQPILVEEPSVETTIQILRGLKSKLEKHHGLIFDHDAIEQAAILSDKYIRDRFLPDKAIDIMDEAAARVRLENRNLPRGMQIMLAEVHAALKEKEDALRDQSYIEAASHLENEMNLRTHLKIMKQSLEKSVLKGFTREKIDTVTANDIANVIAERTKIPVNKVSGTETIRLLDMENEIHKRIIGQHKAVSAISSAVRRARVGLRNPNRPIASFIFAGPTGVGKTELTKAVAAFLFSGKESLIRFDMSEYMEKHTVAKLIGSPPGYVGYSEGGQLTEAVRSKPYSLVLFDEVEKAHPDVFNLMLQILDDGRLSDSQGRVVDFTNVLVVMTTNLGAKTIERYSGIRPKEDIIYSDFDFIFNDHPFRKWEPLKASEKDNEFVKNVTKLVKDELNYFFRPEFLNRIDEIIIFSHLTKHDIWEISKIMLNQLIERLEIKGIELIIEEPVRAFLVEDGHDPIYGARPLRRTMMRHLEDILAEKCLSMDLRTGTVITVRRQTLKDIKKQCRQEGDITKLRNILMKATIRADSQKFDEKVPFSRFQNLYVMPARKTANLEEKFKILDEEFPNPYRRKDEEIFSTKILVDIKLPSNKKMLRSSYKKRTSKEQPLIFRMEDVKNQKSKSQENPDNRDPDLMKLVPPEFLPENKKKEANIEVNIVENKKSKKGGLFKAIRSFIRPKKAEKDNT